MNKKQMSPPPSTWPRSIARSIVSVYSKTTTDSYTRQLENLATQSRLWRMVAFIGIFGFGWVSGPLAVYHGRKLIRSYQSLGEKPLLDARLAYGIGLASTIIYYLPTVTLMLGLLRCGL